MCNRCQHSFETVQSIRADPLTRCPECAEDSLHRVLHPPACFVRQTPSTIGQAADANTRKLGHYERQEKAQQHAEAARRGREVAGRKPAKRPWWRRTEKVDTSLAGLAPKVKVEKGKVVSSEPLSPKAEKYIMTGKK